QRNSKLTSLAGAMRRVGATEEAIFEALRVENRKRCDPPLPDEDVAGVARSVASRYDPAPQVARPPEPLRVVSAGEFLDMDIKPREMFLNPVVPARGLAMLHGRRGVGKTHVALGMAVAVAGGGTFLKWTAPKPRRVLYVDGELPSSLLQQWLAEIASAIGCGGV